MLRRKMRTWEPSRGFEAGWPILRRMVIFGVHVFRGMVYGEVYGVDGWLFGG